VRSGYLCEEITQSLKELVIICELVATEKGGGCERREVE